ncbi:hypothetical protein CONLIGDRAFT_632222 [Coniochaeta ligniaria NRRL 30616]|uniref:Uncharacterized protein n=1 Tax=Coniochaeta ligniaria NRRL 30616 TaxID=1408157 RepID=A0A1J7JA16_9PEZI|nr:hypothetical protein CONLIGDRAFT_632222 [Coniochaeta ligniaria NRRL 30616]
MDDPWGSPWTTAAPGERTPSPTKSDLEPPPRAFLSATSSPRLPAASVASPWADDNDGFGDWTAADTPAISVQSGSGWAGGWGGAGSDTSSVHGQQHLTPAPKDEGFGFAQASPIAWPGSIALSPNSKNGSGSAFRQPSPDPWASEFDDFKEGQGVQSTPRFVLDRPTTPSPAKEPGVEALHEESASAWDEDGLRAVVDDATEGQAAIRPTEEDLSHNIASADDLDNGVESDHPDQSRPSTSSRPRSSHSRSSSTSRNDTDSDGDRQDSPITSIDEDARSRIALPPRKVSDKIQVLVEKFDGLAKAAVEDPLPVRRESTPQNGGTSDTETPSEEITDFGDFEDAGEAPSTPPVQDPEISSPRRRSVERTPTPRVRSPETPTRQRLPSVTDTSSPDVKSPVVKLMPVEFDVELKQIDSLFNDLQLDPPISHEDLDSILSDHVINDSFTQISERKAWYRISRQGSSRMHNAGDDDSYRRVAWPTTTVHHETLKIVRRWMEQDSITGRTTLGGGTNRTNMFNWDSAAQPVALDEVFAKRRRQARPASLQQPSKTTAIIPPAPTSTGNTNGAVTVSKQRPMSLAGPSAAAFGWSTSPVTQRPAELPQPTKPSKLGLKEGRTLYIAPDGAPSQMSPPPKPAPPQDDEEDEWGEMISSPAIDARPMTLPSFGRPDTKLADTSESGTPPIAPSSNTAPALPAGRQSTEGAYGNIADIWEQPPPVIPPKQSFVEPRTGPQQPSNSGLPAKPTVRTANPVATPGFTPTTALEIISSLPISGETPIEQPATMPPPMESEAEAESLVRQIVDSLPDLSYMLR